MSKQMIYLDSDTKAREMLNRRAAVRAVSNVHGLRFIYKVHPLKAGRVRRSNVSPEFLAAKAEPVQHPKINEVV